MSEDLAVMTKDFVVKDLAPRRLRPQGDRDRRDRDAGADGAARRVRRGEAAEGRADRRVAAHDDPDRGADRDAGGARGERALGVVQHLLDPGSCRGGDRRDRRAGLRGQGRDAGGLLDLYRPHLRLRGRRQHDPRRRRGRDDVHPDRRAGRGRRDRADREPRQRGGGVLLRADQEADAGVARAGS